MRRRVAGKKKKGESVLARIRRDLLELRGDFKRKGRGEEERKEAVGGRWRGGRGAFKELRGLLGRSVSPVIRT